MIKNIVLGAISASLILIGTISAAAQGTPIKAPPAMPRMCPFNINNGAATTTSWSVILNCDTTTTSATEYRASERQDFMGATWSALASAIPFFLTGAEGTKTVYFQLRNAQGTATGVVSKSIVIQTRKDFAFNSRDAQLFANTQGFSFSATPADSQSNCSIVGEQSVNIDAFASGKQVYLGGKCNFILFGGRDLKTGWYVKSYEADGALCTPPGRGYTMIDRPILGYPKITFRFHSWADAPNSCQFIVKKITLNGPASSTDWRDAFR